MSIFMVVCAIIAVLFWRSLLKIAVILAVVLMLIGVLAFVQGIHHVIK